MGKNEVINATEERIDGLVDYMQMKIKERDWHAVCDAANDIREMEERIKTLKEFCHD